MQTNLFLKRVLLLDAVSCLVLGLLLAFGARALAPLFGISQGLVAGAALVLLASAGFIAWVATRPKIAHALVYAIIAANLLWAAESFLFIATNEAVTQIGALFVAAQGLAVLALASLEWFAVRRSREVAA